VAIATRQIPLRLQLGKLRGDCDSANSGCSEPHAGDRESMYNPLSRCTVLSGVQSHNHQSSTLLCSFDYADDKPRMGVVGFFAQ
jgi:hypothetical protein